MACPITVAKFVGTISLGLLTVRHCLLPSFSCRPMDDLYLTPLTHFWQGLSYSISTVTIPALQLLPTASVAAQSFKDIQLRTRRRVVTLSNLTALCLLTAFSLASPRRKHPYLIWTGLVALIGGTGIECWTNRKSMSWGCPCPSSLCGSSSSSSPSCNLGFGSWISTHLGCRRAQAQTEIHNDCRREEEETFGAGSEIEIVEESEAMPTPTTREQSASPVASMLDVNGESIKGGMERERQIQKLRTWILGAAFSMGVVGIWGDGA